LPLAAEQTESIPQEAHFPPPIPHAVVSLPVTH
jgi:hypothetical protein